jgi:hypothetical protein
MQCSDKDRGVVNAGRVYIPREQSENNQKTARKQPENNQKTTRRQPDARHQWIHIAWRPDGN